MNSAPLNQYQQQDGYNFAMMNGFQKFQSLPGVFLQETLQMAEIVCGINMPCNFQVFPADHLGNKVGDMPIFASTEHSECCKRVCLPADCRPYEISMDSYNTGPFLRLHRECACTFLCCNRPEVQVMIVEGGQNIFAGRVVNPFYFCDLGVHIFDKAGNLKYLVEGTCCQTGVCCSGFPCQACQTVNFDVKSPSGEVLSTLTKRSQGCLRAMFTNADNFSIVFPPSATIEDKALLTATALLLNYQYFEKPPQQKGMEVSF